MESENSIFCRHNFCLLVPLLPLRGYASSMKLLIAIFILVISVLISSALVNRSLAAQRYDSMRDARSDFSSALAVSAKKNRFLILILFGMPGVGLVAVKSYFRTNRISRIAICRN